MGAAVTSVTEAVDHVVELRKLTVNVILWLLLVAFILHILILCGVLRLLIEVAHPMRRILRLMSLWDLMSLMSLVRLVPILTLKVAFVLIHKPLLSRFLPHAHARILTASRHHRRYNWLVSLRKRGIPLLLLLVGWKPLSRSLFPLFTLFTRLLSLLIRLRRLWYRILGIFTEPDRDPFRCMAKLETAD